MKTNEQGRNRPMGTWRGMLPYRALSRMLGAAVAVALAALPATVAQATTYYWDCNNGTAGFGTAGGSWAAPTAGTTTYGWSTNSDGTNVVNGNSVTTTTSDGLNFGTGAASRGLAAGTITVSGTVSANSLTYGSQSGAIKLSGSGSITFGGSSPAITVNTTVATSSVPMSVAGGGNLTKGGTGTVVLAGANIFTDSLTVNQGTVTCNTDTSGNAPLGVSYGGNITIAQGAALTCNAGGSGVQTLSGSITNDGTLTCNGLILSGTLSGAGTNVFGGIYGADQVKVDASTAVVASTLTLKGDAGGVFNYDNSAANGTRTPTFAALIEVSGGEYTVTLTGRSGQMTTLTFGGTIPSNANTMRNFVVAGGANGVDSKIAFSGQTVNALVNLSTFFGGASYAFYDTSGYLRGMNYTGTPDANCAAVAAGNTTFTAAGVNGKHVDLGSYSISAATTESIKSLRLTSGSVTLAGGATLTIYDSTSGIAAGGILKTGGGATTISGGTAISVSSGKHLFIRCDTASDQLTISTPIGSAVQNLVKGGAGTLTLTGGLSHAGGTLITGGTLMMNCSQSSASSWSLYNGATLGGSGTITFGASQRLTWASGGTILLGSSGNTLTHISTTAPQILAGARLKVAPTSASTLDKFVHQNASGSFGVANIDLVVDATGLNGQSLSSQTILQTTGGATITGGTAFRSVSTNNGYTCSLANSGTAVTLTLTAPTPTKLVVTSVPASATAGQSFSVTVQAQDNSGNPAGVVADTAISLSVNGATGGILSGNTGTISAGTSSVTLSTVQYTKAGVITLTASGGSLTSGTSSSITVNPGTATKLQILVPGETAAPGSATGKTGTPSNQTAGTPIASGIVVNAVDANWNKVSSQTPNVSISSTDGAPTIADDNGGTAGNMTLAAGTATLSSFTFNTGGGQTITATDAAAGLTSDTSASITVIAGGVVTATWNGGSLVDNDWSTTANWVSGTAPTKSSGTDEVVFDGVTRLTPNMEDNYNIGNLTFAASAGSFTLGATAGKTLTMSSGDVVNNSANTQTLNLPITRPAARAFNAASGNIVVNGVVSGAALTKNGTSNLVLAAANDYTGGTTINAGTLQLGDGTANNGSVLGAIANDATLAIANPSDQTVGNTISGTGALTKSGAGTATLTGANTYSGSSTLNAGAINLGVAQVGVSSGPLGANGTISLGGGTLQYSAANQNDYSARFSTAAGQQYKVDNNGQNVTWDTALTSSGGSLTKSGSGTLTLTAANTYGGGTTIGAGTLQLGDGTSGKDGTVTGNIVDNGTLAFHYFGSQTNSGAVSGSGSVTKSGGGTLTLSGNNSYAGGTTFSAGRLNINHNNALGGGALSVAAGTVLDNTSGAGVTVTNAVTLGGSFTYWGTTNLTQNTGAVTLSAPATLTVTNVLALNGSIGGGANSLTKAGSGTLTLGGNNTYDGLTTVSAGALTLAGNNSAADGGVTVSAGTLNVNHNNALGSGALTISGGTLDNTSGGEVTIGNAVAWNSNFTFTGTTNLTQETGAVTLNGTRQVTVSANTLTLNGVVGGGAVGLTKAGGGTLVLGNVNNSFSGPIIIVRGALSLGVFDDTHNGTGPITLSNSAFPASLTISSGGSGTTSRGINMAGDVNAHATITLDGTLTFTASPFNTAASGAKTLTLSGVGNGTIQGVIQNDQCTISVSKSGTGTWTLSGNSTFSGGVTLSAGQLNLGHANALGSGTMTISGGPTLDNTSGGPLTITNAIAWNSSFTFAGTDSLTQQVGAVTLNLSSPTLTVSNKTLAINGVIDGNANWNVTKKGPGTLALGGANTFLGSVSVNEGTLALTTINSNNVAGPLGNNAHGVSLGSSGLTGTLKFTGTGSSDKGFTLTAGGTGVFEVDAGALTLSGVLTTGGTVHKTGMGTLVLSNTGSSYSGALSVKAGTLSVPVVNDSNANGPLGKNTGAVTLGDSGATGTLEYTGNTATSSKKFTLATGGTGVFQVDTAGQTLTLSGLIDGSGNLTKTGDGTLALSTSDTYNGNTTISAGTLALTGSGAIASTPKITIAGGASLDVSGLTSAMALGAGQQLETTATGSGPSATNVVASGKGLTLSAGGLAVTQYGGGAMAPLTVDGASAGGLALNGAPVTVTTSTVLPPGSYKLIAKAGSATGVSGAPGTLTVNGSGADGEVLLRVDGGELFLDVLGPAGTVFTFR